MFSGDRFIIKVHFFLIVLRTCALQTLFKMKCHCFALHSFDFPASCVFAGGGLGSAPEAADELYPHLGQAMCLLPAQGAASQL